MAEGGRVPRTQLEAQAGQSRQWAQSGGPGAAISRIAQGAPDQKRKIDDSPATMRKNREALKKGKR